jgi:hypothetical protein
VVEVIISMIAVREEVIEIKKYGVDFSDGE